MHSSLESFQQKTMKGTIFLFNIIFLGFSFVIQTTSSAKINSYDFPFWDEKLPLGKRLDDLMGRLTMEEMVSQMENGGGVPEKPAPGIERLGILPYNFDSECLHGIPGLNSTTFPMPINMAATFNEELVYQVAAAVSTEVRGVFNKASQKSDYRDMRGLNCFAPFVNMMRHPLWGRSQETFGEDPFLIGVMAANYVKGLQGRDADDMKDVNITDSQPLKGRYVRVIAGCKHFVSHSGPDNIPSSRFSFNAKVGLRDFLLSYLPAFQQCINAGAQNVMCSYNSLNGVPTCASRTLLQSLLRQYMAFGGFVVSDLGAIENIFTGHNYTSNLKEAGIAAASAGVDLNLHGNTINAFSFLEEAVKEGRVPRSTLEASVRRLFRARFLLGLFDPPALNPYSDIRMEEVLQSAYHRRLALQVAEESIVLLKNNDHTLPVKAFGRLSLIGPACDDLDFLFGGYAPNVVPEFSSTPYQALRKHASTTTLAKGCSDSGCSQYNSTEVVMATKGVDFVLVCLGTGTRQENEGLDRDSLKLPGHQEQLLSDVMSHVHAPIVLLTFSATPLDITRAKVSAKVSSILHAFHPGQAGGEALERMMVVRNDNGMAQVTSPSGRMPSTWPAFLQQVPPMADYSMKERTYRYSTSQPLYPFGYGLSYSSFFYSNLSISPSLFHCNANPLDEAGCLLSDDDVITITVDVTNTGSYDADEVMQVYLVWKDLPSGLEMPKLQLVAFQRVPLYAAAGAVRVEGNFKVSQLKVLNQQDSFVYLPGALEVYVGGQQPNTRTTSNSNILRSTIIIAQSDDF